MKATGFDLDVWGMKVELLLGSGEESNGWIAGQDLSLNELEDQDVTLFIPVSVVPGLAIRQLPTLAVCVEHAIHHELAIGCLRRADGMRYD